MTCHHDPGDPACSSTQARYGSSYEPPRTPDIEKYTIEDLVRFNEYMVLKVKYPNCSKCAYEGTKVLVLPSVPELEVLRWQAVDPHFRDPNDKSFLIKKAPAPVARFPASPEGWKDALAYAKTKSVLKDEYGD